jgi:dienelactone hydrolase
MDADEWGDAAVARDLAQTVESAELFLYPGDQHLFTDDSLPAYDAGAPDLVVQRVVHFLDAVPRR